MSEDLGDGSVKLQTKLAEIIQTPTKVRHAKNIIKHAVAFSDYNFLLTCLIHQIQGMQPSFQLYPEQNYSYL